MKKLASAVIALGAIMLGGQAALAADLRAAPVYKAPPAPVVTVYNWTGCYIGGNVGGAFDKSTVNIPAYPANFDIKNSGVTGGGQAGCNYMFANNWVIGIEGDYDLTDLNGSAPTINSPVVGERFSVKWDAAASIRGRLGYAWDRSLFYITGGGAFAHLDNATYIPAVAGSRSDWYSGWTIGGGIEHAFTQNWILGVEYLYADYGKKDYVFAGPTSVSHTSNTVRGRLSYKF